MNSRKGRATTTSLYSIAVEAAALTWAQHGVISSEGRAADRALDKVRRLESELQLLGWTPFRVAISSRAVRHAALGARLRKALELVRIKRAQIAVKHGEYAAVTRRWVKVQRLCTTLRFRAAMLACSQHGNDAAHAWYYATGSAEHVNENPEDARS